MRTKAFLTSLSFIFLSSFVQGEGKLTVYCNAQVALCEAQVKAFSQKHQVKTNFVRLPTGTTLAKIQLEAKNPQADVWYGGTLDAHHQAAQLNLLQPYLSPQFANLAPSILPKMPRNSANIPYSSPILMDILGFGVNVKRLKDLGIEDIPRCWRDLTHSKLKGEIIMPDVQSSGTAYTGITTYVALWGEKNAFHYMKGLDKNINHYAKSGIAPAQLTAQGEYTVGIGFLQGFQLQKKQGAPLAIIQPCEGSGSAIFAASILKNSLNLTNAKLFMDWILSKEGQELVWQQTPSAQILVNTMAKPSPLAPKLEEVNIVEDDFAYFNDPKIRNYLINKWVMDVKKQQN